ncbi:MAG: DUF4339 domain-containing protein [Verrucomicrobiaceae bacterium]|nr:DUF4339 domain-containing protein [Verrucomicrobiaceae bacterium]
MKIFLIRGGKCAGPFQAGELRQKISSGGVSPGELAWGAGLDDWSTLEKVLAKAEDMSASGEGDSVDQESLVPPPVPESSRREKSTKLQSVPVPSPGDGGQYQSPIQAVPDAAEKQREAKRSGAASAARPNALGFLRWIGVLAVLFFLVTAFMPWVRTTTAAGRTELSAVKMVLAAEEEVALPGQTVAPKYFGLSKMILVVSLILALLIGLISVSNILSRDAENSGLGILISGVLFVALVFIGVVYDHFFEREFNTALAQALPGVEDQDISFKMDYGFYLALASVILMTGCLMIPKVVAGSLLPVMVPFFVAVAIASGFGGFGFLRMGSRNALQKAYGDVKQLLPSSDADNQGGDKADGDADEGSPPE